MNFLYLYGLNPAFYVVQRRISQSRIGVINFNYFVYVYFDPVAYAFGNYLGLFMAYILKGIS